MNNDINKKIITADLQKYDLERLNNGKYLYKFKNGKTDVDQLDRDIGQYIENRKIDEEQSSDQETMQDKKEIDKNMNTTPLYNLSIGQIAINMKNTLFNLLDDILSFNFSPSIFYKDDRLFYLGILIIVIGILFLIFMFFISMDYPSQNIVTVQTVQPAKPIQPVQ